MIPNCEVFRIPPETTRNFFYQPDLWLEISRSTTLNLQFVIGFKTTPNHPVSRSSEAPQLLSAFRTRRHFLGLCQRL